MTSILGKDSITNIPVGIDKGDRREGLYIIGSSGTGKSTLLSNLIQQDIKDNTGLCLLDAHGDLIQRTIEIMPPDRYEDVILLDISNPTYAFGVNLFQCNNITDMEEVENTISQVMHLLDKVYSISSLTPMMNQYFLNLTQTLLYNQPSSFLDIPRLLGDLPKDKNYRATLAANVPNIQTRRFWASFTENRHHWRTIESISAIENKLDDFFRPVLKTIFGQELTTINMREIMDDPAGKIVLVKMNARWESITKLVGSVIVGQILDAAYSRSDIPVKKRRHFSLYADEFQWFASQDFATLFSEARKYGIGLTIAHQTLEQVDPHIIATCKQAKSIVSFRVSGENAQSLASQFDSTPPIPTETRREAILVPKQNVIDHILNHGHPDPRVSKFVTEYLQFLKKNIIDERVSGGYDDGTRTLVYSTGNSSDAYTYTLSRAKNSYDKLNNLMYSRMFPRSQWPEINMREKLEEEFSEILGYSNYYHTQVKPDSPQAQQAQEAYEKARKEQNKTAKDASELAWDMLTVDKILGKQYRNDTSIDEAMKQKEREFWRFTDFTLAFFDLLVALEEQPIMTESGRYEEKPVMQRTYADRQGEIANMLTRLPSMHSYVRVAGEEHAIEITHTQSDNIKRAPIANIIKTITEWNEEDGYIRKRSEVEAEIDARQNDDDPPQPPSPGGSSNEPSDNGATKQPGKPVPTPRRRQINS